MKRGRFKAVKCHNCGFVQITTTEKRFNCKGCKASRKIGDCIILLHSDVEKRVMSFISLYKAKNVNETNEFHSYEVRK